MARRLLLQGSFQSARDEGDAVGACDEDEGGFDRRA